MSEYYTHNNEIHNLQDPQVIVPKLFKMLNPKSVIDVGCGTGNFLALFKEQGVKKVLGLDGFWVDKNHLHILDNEFSTADLEKPIKLKEKYDLALCLEVGEHLNPSSADILVDNLTSLSDTIIFSAAIPMQGGHKHINEQWPEYWQEKFAKKNYRFIDCLRKLFWTNNKVFWWYRQNMFLVTSRDDLHKKYSSDLTIFPYVHPKLFEKRAKDFHEIVQGKKNFLFYLKLLIKCILKMNK